MSAHAPLGPSGQQYEIAAAGYRAVITEVGATLRLLQINGTDIVDGFGPQDRVEGGHGQQLMPWPNRIADGRYSFGGRDYQLDLSEPARGNALHGLVRWARWEIVEHTEDSLTQQLVLFPQSGWDTALRCSVRHQLSASGLVVTVQAENVGDRAVPFGYAAHPYFTLGETTVDEVSMTVPAAQFLEVDPQRLLPIAVRSVENRPEDLRDGSPLGDRDFDTAFTDLSPDPSTGSSAEAWRVRLTHRDRETVIWGDEQHRWIQIYTGAGRRDIGMAVEPMTCGPDAFNNPDTAVGLVVLEPGDGYQGRWGIQGR